MYRTDGKAQNFILNLFQSFGKAFNPVCTQPTVKHSKEEPYCGVVRSNDWACVVAMAYEAYF